MCSVDSLLSVGKRLSNRYMKVVIKKDTFPLLKVQTTVRVTRRQITLLSAIIVNITVYAGWEVAFERQLEVESGGGSFLLCQLAHLFLKVLKLTERERAALL